MILSADLETWPIHPGVQAPPISFAGIYNEAGDRSEILSRDLFLDLWDQAPDITWVWFNAAYDLACIAATGRIRDVFDRYEKGQIICTRVRELLIQNARGRLKIAKSDLLSCLRRYKIPTDLREEDKGQDTWRLRYSELEGIPPESWPEEPRIYLTADAKGPIHLMRAQDAAVPDHWLLDAHRQTMADFVLKLLSVWGVRPDQEYAAEFRLRLLEEYEEIKDRLIHADLVRNDGSKDTKAAKALMLDVCRRKGLRVAITDTGKDKLSEGWTREQAIEEGYISLNAEACEGTGNQTLVDYARYGSVGTLIGRVEDIQRAGDLPIQSRFNVLVESGRLSCTAAKPKPGQLRSAYGFQLHNPHREAGLRECLVARPGHVFVSVDWSAAELHSLAQVCVDFGLGSELGRVLNAGKDPHLSLACQLHGWDYEWAKANKKGPEVKEQRQGMKASNFGFPGGLGVEKFRRFAASTYGLDLSEEQGTILRDNWFRAYPEMRGYFQIISDLVDRGDPVVQVRSWRVRGGVRFTSAANSYFQGLTADMAKDALWRVSRECYLGPGPLEGCRPWNLPHDEILAEVPVDRAHEAATRIVDLMEAAGRQWCPDAPPRAEPAISYRWRKGAEPEYRDGRLIPWEDRPWEDEEREKVREALRAGEKPVRLSWRFGREVSRIMEAA